MIKEIKMQEVPTFSENNQIELHDLLGKSNTLDSDDEKITANSFKPKDKWLTQV